jgi:hypothetical protein
MAAKTLSYVLGMKRGPRRPLREKAELEEDSISLSFAKNRADLRSDHGPRAKIIFARSPMKFGATISRHDLPDADSV